jgi:hypothetical protein
MAAQDLTLAYEAGLIFPIAASKVFAESAKCM